MTKKVKEVAEEASHKYGKWDGTESVNDVFEMIKSGKMNLRGFNNWVDQMEVEATRYLFPM